MHKKPIILLLILILTTTAYPALANNNTFFTYSVIYELEGYIDIEREIGKKCETGAVMKQTIKGYAEKTKTETIQIADYIIAVDQEMDWSVPPGAIENLVVTSTIELCARPMSTVVEDTFPITTATWIYLRPRFFNLVYPFIFDPDRLDPENLIVGLDEETGEEITLFDILGPDTLFPLPVYRIIGYEYEAGDLINPYDRLVIDEEIEVAPLTKQIWATYIETEPDHFGNYHAAFIAAYGPGPYEERGIIGILGDKYFLDKEIMWWFDGRDPSGISRGDRYVGNYFDIEHYANTTGGEMYRLISMSDPIHNLLFEDEFTVVGSAEVKEAFSMKIIEGGPKAERFDWWAIF